MKIQNKQTGFTLIELITVVSLISLLVVYITVELGQSNDDAKVAMSTTFLLGNIPQAIGSYKARHLGSCSGIDEFDADTPVGLEEEADDELKHLVSRGLYHKTPWDEDWTVTYDADARKMNVVFPMTGSDNPDVAGADIVENLTGKPQVENDDPVPDYDEDEETVTVSYDCV